MAAGEGNVSTLLVKWAMAASCTDPQRRKSLLFGLLMPCGSVAEASVDRCPVPP